MARGRNIWWVRRGGEVRGPFVTGLVRRHVLLGRIRLDDEVSQDREVWRRVGEVDALVPDEVRDPGPDGERLLQARLREDERSPGDRRRRRPADAPGRERRRGVDRRAPEPDPLVKGRHVWARTLQERYRARPRYTAQLALLVGLVAVLAVGVLRLNPPAVPEGPDCATPPAPGVDWRGCRMEGLRLPGAALAGASLRDTDLRGADLRGADLRGADLSYANLSAADLRGADLRQARLIGAGLRNARLDGADLRGARLDYADLTGAELGQARVEGARLDQAIWTDGLRCGPGSLGRCAVADPG